MSCAYWYRNLAIKLMEPAGDESGIAIQSLQPKYFWWRHHTSVLANHGDNSSVIVVFFLKLDLLLLPFFFFFFSITNNDDGYKRRPCSYDSGTLNIACTFQYKLLFLFIASKQPTIGKGERKASSTRESKEKSPNRSLYALPMFLSEYISWLFPVSRSTQAERA